MVLKHRNRLQKEPMPCRHALTYVALSLGPRRRHVRDRPGDLIIIIIIIIIIIMIKNNYNNDKRKIIIIMIMMMIIIAIIAIITINNNDNNTTNNNSNKCNHDSMYTNDTSLVRPGSQGASRGHSTAPPPAPGAGSSSCINIQIIRIALII